MLLQDTEDGNVSTILSSSLSVTTGPEDGNVPSISLSDLFERVAHLVRESDEDPNVQSDVKLHLYALYKQAKYGQCQDSDRPSAFRVIDTAKFNKWRSLMQLSATDAMKLYIDLISQQPGLVGLKVRQWIRDSAIFEVGSDASHGLKHSNGLTTPKTLKKWMGIQPVIPRGCIDISCVDLAWAAWWSLKEVVRSSSLAQRQFVQARIEEQCERRSSDRHAIVGLSVRSLLDLYLRVSQFASGSEVIVSPAITVPSMISVLEHYNLVVVPVDLPTEKQVSVDESGIQRAFNDRTVAVIVVHVFGMFCADGALMKRLSSYCIQKNVTLIEDCAECYQGLQENVLGSPFADASFFSFGLIKTATALGGGIAFCKNKRERDMMRSVQTLHFPCFAASRYAGRVSRACALKVASHSPLMYGLVLGVARSLLSDVDGFVTSLIRGFGTDYLSHRIRKSPNMAMLKLLQRRLNEPTVSKTVLDRCIQMRALTDILGSASFCYIPNRQHTAWLQPIRFRPTAVSRSLLLANGHDVTAGSSQLIAIGDACKTPYCHALMTSLVYAPLYPSQHVQDLCRHLFMVAHSAEQQGELRQRNRQWNTMRTFLCACAATYTVIAFRVAVLSILIICCVILVSLRELVTSTYLQHSKALSMNIANLNEKLFVKDPKNTVLACFQKFRLIDTSSPRSVVLVGATGFIGSTLLWTLLFHRQTLGIERVYIIARRKGSLSAASRIRRMLQEPMFCFLREEEKSRLVIVCEGDATLPWVGLCESDLTAMRTDSSVSHVINCAAYVNFNLSLRDAARFNISSALELKKLAEDFQHQVTFLHVSTAFVHGSECGSSECPLDENLFSLGIFDPEALFESMKGLPFYASKAMTELGFKNTYTFSKCVAEHLLCKSSKTRTIILRPSIIGPSIQEPFRGWAGKSPSTIVAAPCLFFSFPYVLWAFGRHCVPCLPVDIFCSHTVSLLSSSMDQNKACATSKKVSVINVAWNSVRSSDKSPDQMFTWTQYVIATAQTGSIVGLTSRFVSYMGIFVSMKLFPALKIGEYQFKWLHRLVSNATSMILRWQGETQENLDRMRPILNLPVFFYHYMNNDFVFQSNLIIPTNFDAEEYMMVCISAAVKFATKRLANNQAINLRARCIAGAKDMQTTNACLWSILQPRGSALVRLLAAVLRLVFRLTFQSLTVDLVSFSTSMKALKDENRDILLLAPNHRSFFDFLVISYICFALPELQIPIPVVVASSSFKELPIVGLLVRALGVIFVKRGLGRKDSSLRERIKELPEGSSLEAYLEGTRSRDRRFLCPKTGLLRCLESIDRDVCVFPLTISYERICEQASLSADASGGAKDMMSLRRMMNWFVHLLSGCTHLGDVHVAAGRVFFKRHFVGADLNTFGRQLQDEQVHGLVVSPYHERALAIVLCMEVESVHQAVLALGCRVWHKDHCTLPASPDSDDESWTLALHLSPFLASLLKTTLPRWSAWLYPGKPPSVKITGDKALQLLGEKLRDAFIKAEMCLQSAILELSRRGLGCVDRRRAISLAHRQGKICRVLLNGAYKALGIVEPTFSHMVSNSCHYKQLVHCEEEVGYWGYRDTRFVAQIDSDGPYVEMQGEHTLVKGKMRNLLPFMESELGISLDLVPSLPQGVFLNALESRQIVEHCLLGLDECVSHVSKDLACLLRHGHGHSLSDICKLRMSCNDHRYPDAVVWPVNIGEIQALVHFARQKSVCLIPFGGGTNVTSATYCPAQHCDPRPIVTVSMAKMNKVLEVDEVNGLARVQAGITGRKLSNDLRVYGYTTGHEPDSYEFSTVGGWVATKASGMKRNKYGNIEDIVTSIDVVGADGELLQHGHGRAARESAQVDLLSLFLGSEGCLGIIVSATMRICPLPLKNEFDSIILPSFEAGLQFCRKMVQQCNPLPTSVRLLDNGHFRLGQALRPETHFVPSDLAHAFRALVIRSRADQRKAACVTVLYEGSSSIIKLQKRCIRMLATQFNGLMLGSKFGKQGYNLTYAIAYLRDFALSHGLLSNSIETFVSWSSVENVVRVVGDVVRCEHESQALPGEPFVCCRATQLYHEGVCLYVYIAMYFPELSENASRIFQKIEEKVKMKIITTGGSLSHHHGIGKQSDQLLQRMDSAAWLHAKSSIKNAMDMKNIFGARNGAYSIKYM